MGEVGKARAESNLDALQREQIAMRRKLAEKMRRAGTKLATERAHQLGTTADRLEAELARPGVDSRSR